MPTPLLSLQNEHSLMIVELLGMYHAELARIPDQQCGDIDELSSGSSIMESYC